MPPSPRLRLLLALVAALPALHGADPATAADQTVVLSPFEVSDAQDHGYASTNAIGGTRFAAALTDIPQSIVVLNQEFMHDIAASTVADAAVYVSGVETHAGAEHGQFNVRGYAADQATDGLPDASVSSGQEMSSPYELVDRVEILKGPAAVLYGSTSVGGNVNSVLKKPVLGDHLTIDATAGDGGWIHTDVDANRSVPVGPGALAVRVLGAYEQYDTYANYRDLHRYVAAPEVSYMLGDRTKITLIAYYLQSNAHKLFADLFQMPPYGQGAPIAMNVPRDADFGSPSAREKILVHRIYLSVEQKMTNWWTVHLAALSKDDNEITNDIIPRDLLAVGGGRYLMQRTWRILQYQGDYKVAAFDNLFTYRTGPLKNKTLVLGQYNKQVVPTETITGKKLSGQNTALGETSNTTSNLPLIDPFNYTPIDVYPDSTSTTAWTQAEGEVAAVSVQDMSELDGGRLIFNLGARSDRTRSYGKNVLTHATTVDSTNSHVTTRAGMVYKPLPGFSLFFNYSSTFAPIFTLNPDGTGFKPTEGRIYEFGPKLDLLDGRISATASVFRLDQVNELILDADPLRASAGYRTQRGKDSIEGVEMDWAYSPFRNFQAIASFSELKEVANGGLRQVDVPDKTAALFASYKFGAGDPAWMVGAGAHYKGKRPGDTANDFYLPGAGVADAFLSYRYDKQLRFRLDCTNLFDRWYADSAVNRNDLFAGNPRRTSVTVTYSY